jgi:hypothetical protein
MKHLKNNNETYLSHFIFAGRLGVTLMFRGFLFLLHAVFPFCELPKKWNLNDIQKKINKWHKYSISRGEK